MAEREFSLSANEGLEKPLNKSQSTLHHPFSDIDILFEESEEQKISEGELSKIKESLENSMLAIKVDLVSSKHIAKSFVKKVDSEKIEI